MAETNTDGLLFDLPTASAAPTYARTREAGIMYGNNQADERAARRLRLFCPAHSFETHAHARETGTMYGDNRADERAARRLRGAAGRLAGICETHAHAREPL